MEMQKLYLLVPLAPLFGAIIAGLFCRVIPRWVAHTVTIAGVAIAFIASVVIFQDVQAGNVFNGSVYTWLKREKRRWPPCPGLPRAFCLLPWLPCRWWR